MNKNICDIEIYLKLKEAECQAVSEKRRYTHEETMSELRNIITKAPSPKKGTLEYL